ncbi:MAG TPA: hypothetical protein VK689_17355 [Armatimonadota bacterium]|nr:hypothetical protein [Armatimonadota bacterium]
MPTDYTLVALFSTTIVPVWEYEFVRWLQWFALGCQPVALWLLLATRRGVRIPEWLFPVRGKWLRRLAWTLLLGSSGCFLWELAKPRFDQTAWDGVVVWGVVELVLLLVSVAVFEIVYKLVRDHQEMVKTPLHSAPDADAVDESADSLSE